MAQTQAMATASPIVLDPTVSSHETGPLSDDNNEYKNDRLSSPPAELLEKILEQVLVSDSPIEFSPMGDSTIFGAGISNFTAVQYQHVLDFQQKIRPALGLLRVSRRFQTEGSRVYYSKNAFRFSGGYGWLVVARFLDLIGEQNIQRLKHLSIVHPAQETPMSRHHYESFFVRRLSPFGMADLQDYANTYTESQQEWRLKPARDPLTILRSIKGLENLSLLLHNEEPTWLEDVEMLVYHLTTESFDKILTWERQSKLQIAIINLSPRFDPSQPSNSCKYLKLSDVENATLDASWYSNRAANTIEAAQSVATATKAKGWRILDLDWCPETGVWPLEVHQALPWTEVDKYVEDLEGWTMRNNLEHVVGYTVVEGHGWTIPSGPRVLPVSVEFQSCVRCWRKGGFRACVCDDGPASLKGELLMADRIIIGNPGSPLHLDEKMECLVWTKSWAVKDAERLMGDLDPVSQGGWTYDRGVILPELSAWQRKKDVTQPEFGFK